MLKYLRIQNIILVEEAHIPFSAGLNVLTGETGSGKSAIMYGLSLAIGERADTSLIRKGCDKGIVEAVFDIDRQAAILSFLTQAGIDHEPGQELIIRREIALTGKGRLFINHQLAQVALLRQIGHDLVQIVGQHANQRLFSLDHHREILDVYGELSRSVQAYQTHYQQENKLRQDLHTLIHQESQRLREIDICQKELEELNEANLKEGEEEELFNEYTLLAHSKEIAEKVQEINQALTGERQAILTNLYRQKALFDSLVQIDPHLSETAKAFHTAFLELQEISISLRQYQNHIQHDPDRLAFIHERLAFINRLKRRYGSSLAEVQTYQAETKAKLAYLENADMQIEDMQTELKNKEALTNQLAQELTAMRHQTAQQLEKDLTHQLHALNMSKAKFIIQITPQKRTTCGDDRIEFFLQPNVGEHQIALKDGASGGEVSRVLLALQTLLAGKEKTPVLIFDEVDANVGGETATIVGNKLKQIGQQHQVICITHFPQVAEQAHHHLQISKQEKEERTVTIVQCLDALSRQKELERMTGGKAAKRERKKQNQHDLSFVKAVETPLL